MTRPWEHQTSPHRFPDYMRDPRQSGSGMRELRGVDLVELKKMLYLLSKYFEPEGECRKTVSDCIDITEGLHAMWIRNSAGTP